MKRSAPATGLLEKTVSIEEAAAHLGCGRWQVNEFLKHGARYGRALHPWRGGIFGSFKVSHKCRRITVTAIEAHKRHLARLGTDLTFVVQQLERARKFGMFDVIPCLERRAAQLERHGPQSGADHQETPAADS